MEGRIVEYEKQRLLTVSDVGSILNLGKNTVYLLINRDDFPKIKFGKSIRVPEQELYNWMSMSVGHKFSLRGDD